MSARPPRTLPEILQRAEGAFWSDRSLSVWEAVQLTLERLGNEALAKIYRAAKEDWCQEALRHGGDALVEYGMEELGLKLRENSGRVRAADDQRGRDPKDVARARLHRNRQAARSRGRNPRRTNPPRRR